MRFVFRLRWRRAREGPVSAAGPLPFLRFLLRSRFAPFPRAQQRFANRVHASIFRVSTYRFVTAAGDRAIVSPVGDRPIGSPPVGAARGTQKGLDRLESLTRPSASSLTDLSRSLIAQDLALSLLVVSHCPPSFQARLFQFPRRPTKRNGRRGSVKKKGELSVLLIDNKHTQCARVR